jgi:hypothetical protein
VSVLDVAGSPRREGNSDLGKEDEHLFKDAYASGFDAVKTQVGYSEKQSIAMGFSLTTESYLRQMLSYHIRGKLHLG